MAGVAREDNSHPTTEAALQPSSGRHAVRQHKSRRCSNPKVAAAPRRKPSLDEVNTLMLGTRVAQ